MIVQRWSDVSGKKRWRRVALAMGILVALAGGLSLLNRPPDSQPPQTARVERGDIEKACWRPGF